MEQPIPTDKQKDLKIEERILSHNFSKVIEGDVVSVNSKEVVLRLSDGRTALIEKNQFSIRGESPDDVLSVGDRASGVELSRVDSQSRVILSRAFVQKQELWGKLEKSKEENELIKGKVTAVSESGLQVDVGLRAFAPKSHIEKAELSELAQLKGQSLEFKIIELDRNLDKILLSRRSILKKEHKEKVKEVFSSLEVGKVVVGKVVRKVDFGVFISLGEVDGMVHNSQLAWEDSNAFKDSLEIDQEVSAIVTSFSKSKGRVELSIKKLQTNPIAELEVGSVTTGVIEKIMPHGVLVRIDSGYTGLVHISEITMYHISDPAEVVAPGDTVSVKILSVDPESNKIKLSISQAVEI